MDYEVPQPLRDALSVTMENVKTYRIDKNVRTEYFIMGYCTVYVNFKSTYITIDTLGITWIFEDDFKFLKWIHCNGKLTEKSLKVIFKILREVNEKLCTGYIEKKVDQDRILDLVLNDIVTDKQDNFCEIKVA